MSHGEVGGGGGGVTLLRDAGTTVPYFPADSVSVRVHVVPVAGSERLAPPHSQTQSDTDTHTVTLTPDNTTVISLSLFFSHLPHHHPLWLKCWIK